jgi:hypothetical protein
VIRSNVVNKATTAEREQAGTIPDDGALLAAVLAATLVEYQKNVRQHNGPDSSVAVGSNWRLLGCVDRLGGRQ